jgi:hypothetical protein
VQAGLGLLLAVLVNQKLRGVTFFRIVYFIPVVTSIVVVSILWKFMYQPTGLINSFIDTVTFGALQGADWLNNPSTALPAIIVLSIWQAVGFHMLIWLSGLQTIPDELYERSRPSIPAPRCRKNRQSRQSHPRAIRSQCHSRQEVRLPHDHQGRCHRGQGSRAFRPL